MADIDRKEFVRDSEFNSLIETSKNIGLSVLTMYEFFARYANELNYVKSKCRFVRNKITCFLGYPSMDIIFDNNMLSNIILMGKEDYGDYINMVFDKKILIEVTLMYDFLKAILKRYEYSIIKYYKYKFEFDFIRCTEKWLLESKHLWSVIRISFTSA